MKIVDNILPESYRQELLNVVNNNFTWNWSPSSTYEDLSGDHNMFWDKQMVSVLYMKGQVMNNNYSFFLPIIFILEEKLGVQMKNLYRMKVNKTFTCPEDVYVDSWHSDHPEAGPQSILLYLDESDGGTLISNVRYKEGRDIKPIAELRKMIKPDAKIEYVEHKTNRAVMFEANMLHHGEFPKKHKCRTVLNLVFS
jgi:hypothetical protein